MVRKNKELYDHISALLHNLSNGNRTSIILSKPDNLSGRMKDLNIDLQDILYIVKTCDPSRIYQRFTSDGKTFVVCGENLDKKTICVAVIVSEDKKKLKILKIW